MKGWRSLETGSKQVVISLSSIVVMLSYVVYC